MYERVVRIFLGLIVAGSLVGTSAVRAATTTSSVNGRAGATAHGCLQQLVVNVGGSENCMYNGGPSFDTTVGQYPFGESMGPVSQAQYYDSVATPQAFDVSYGPSFGDGKIRQIITGTVTIDDNGTPAATDDLISFTLTFRSPGSGNVIRQLGNTNTATEDQYTTMTQVLAPHAVNFATPNADGGFDYVIGSQGFPERLVFTDATASEAAEDLPGSGHGRCVGQLFGDMECQASFDALTVEPLRWAPWSKPASGRPGIGSLENNLGARTVGSVTGFSCVDTGVSNACKISKVSWAPLVLGPNNTPGGGQTAEDVGWDELLFKVSTDATGKVVSAEGYDVQDYMVFGLPRVCGNDPGSTFVCNSWLAGHFDLSGVVARDDSGLAVGEGIPTAINVLANDTGFQDPVTVTIQTQGTQGVAAVSGSPGPATGIRVVYTAAAGSAGDDSFVYQVTDGTSTGTATVNLTIIPPGTATDDTATTTINTPVDIPVGKNDAFSDPATVTINNGSFSSGGNATVSAGNSGPPGGIVVTYTPVSASIAPGYVENFTYTISDGGVHPDQTAAVFVSVGSLLPVATSPTLELSTEGVDPLAVSETFCPPGAIGSLGATPTAVTITSQSTHGTATVEVPQTSNHKCQAGINLSDRTIRYSITDPTFWYGTDQFTYLLTDKNGVTASGTVTIHMLNKVPTLAVWNLAADQDHSTTLSAIAKFIAFGNGSRAQHPVIVSTQGANGICKLRTISGVDAPDPTGNGALVYTPNAGFSGTDSCTLTVTDENGTGQQALSTFNITVNPLMTVTPNVGGASIDPWSLSLLGILPFLRRRRGHALRPRAKATQLRRAAAAMALLGASVGAFGQGAPPETPETSTAGPEKTAAAPVQTRETGGAAIGEIVVTARKVAENLKEVPLAITAFDADTIAATGIQSLGDVANLTPGLSFFNAFGENLPVPVIRGVVPTDIFGQNNAAVFVDGVYVAGREGLNFNLIDVERIEVVKGPQSALYGRNAFSGAINYVSKRPSKEFEGKVDAEAGNAGKLKGSISVSGPILGDSLRGSAAALYDDWDGSYTNPLSRSGQGELGGYRYRSYRLGLFWTPISDLEVNVGYYKSDDRINEPAIVALPLNCEDQVQPPAGIPHVDGLPDINPTPGTRLLNFCGEIPGLRSIPGLNGGEAIPKVKEATGENRNLDRVNLRVDWDLHDYGSLSALSGFSYTKNSNASDFERNLGNDQHYLYCTPATAESPGNPNTCLNNSSANQFFTSGAYNLNEGSQTTEFSQELRYTSPRDARLRYSGGAYWYKTQVLGYPGALVLTTPPRFGTASDPLFNGKSVEGLPIINGVPIGMPPFDATAPDFAIGSAIFFGTMTPDGGTDPLRRVSQQDQTEGWAIFYGLDWDFTERLTGNLEARLNEEAQHNQALGYTPCNPDKTAPSVAACGDDYYNLLYAAPIYANAADGICTGLDGLAVAIGRCSKAVDARFQLITGRGGLKYKLDDDWMVYGSIAYGEKPGGARLVQATVVCPTTGTLPQGCPSPDGTIPTVAPNPFGIESMLAYELGLKGVGLGRRVGVDLAVFFNDWRDIVLRQLLDVDPVTGLGFSQPTGFNVNAGRAHVLGAEATAQVAFTEDNALNGTFTFGWVDAKIENARQDTYARFPSFRGDCGVQPSDPNLLRDWWNACNQASGITSGNTLLRQPAFKASGSLAYTRPLFGDWDWTARTDVSYNSRVYLGNDNESWLPPHTLVNAKLGVQSPRYTLQLWVRNLLNNADPIAAFRDIYWANTNNLYPPFTDQGPRPNFNSFVPLRYSVSYPSERTIGLAAQVRFGGAVK